MKTPARTSKKASDALPAQTAAHRQGQVAPLKQVEGASRAKASSSSAVLTESASRTASAQTTVAGVDLRSEQIAPKQPRGPPPAPAQHNVLHAARPSGTASEKWSHSAQKQPQLTASSSIPERPAGLTALPRRQLFRKAVAAADVSGKKSDTGLSLKTGGMSNRVMSAALHGTGRAAPARISPPWWGEIDQEDMIALLRCPLTKVPSS